MQSSSRMLLIPALRPSPLGGNVRANYWFDLTAMTDPALGQLGSVPRVVVLIRNLSVRCYAAFIGARRSCFAKGDTYVNPYKADGCLPIQELHKTLHSQLTET
jgi:hypothetical protein